MYNTGLFPNNNEQTEIEEMCFHHIINASPQTTDSGVSLLHTGKNKYRQEKFNLWKLNSTIKKGQIQNGYVRLDQIGRPPSPHMKP